MTEGQRTEGQPPAIWRFEPLSAFQPPPASISEATRTGLRGILDRFRSQSPLGTGEDAQDALVRPEPEELERSLPQLSIAESSEALASAVAPWPESPGLVSIRLVVHGYPGLGADAVEALARSRGWRLLEPPTAEGLLRASVPPVVARLATSQEPIAIPGLERWFLRTPHSLAAMRELLSQLALRAAPTLVSCSSWAYAWLSGALQAGTVLPEPMALAAFDAEALATWFGSAGTGRLRFREDKGELILPRDEAGTNGPAEPSVFLRHLSAEARGNPAVARALWARALRRSGAVTGETPDSANAGTQGAMKDDWTVIRWRDLLRPALGRSARPEEVAVLHALALHGGLASEVLERTLPFGGATISRALAAFSASGLVEARDDAWQLTPAGYPAVRRELLDAGHPQDAF